MMRDQAVEKLLEPFIATKRTVLIVDDENTIRELLREILSPYFLIIEASNGQEALAKAVQEQPDLVVCDIRMPKMNGIECCRRLRSQSETKWIPVLILTAFDDQSQQLEAFAEGADDFLLKPFKAKELIARICSKLKRLEEIRSGHFIAKPALEPAVLDCGNLRVVMNRLEVSIEGRVVPLSALEFKLTRFFIENRNTLLSREAILKSVWGHFDVADRTVDTHVASLRRKLKGFNYSFVSVYSAGYMLKSGMITRRDCAAIHSAESTA